MIRQPARNDMIDPSDKQEPTDNNDPHDAIEPIDMTEPIEPIDSTEPVEPIDNSEFRDHSDHLDLPSAPRIETMLLEQHHFRAGEGEFTRPPCA